MQAIVNDVKKTRALISQTYGKLQKMVPANEEHMGFPLNKAQHTEPLV